MATEYKYPQWLMPENSNQDKVSNYSFSFDGVDDYIQAPLDGTSTGGILAATDSDINLTISLWFKLNSSANLKGIFQWANQLNDGTPFVLLQQRNSTDRIRFIVDGTNQSLEDVNIGQWYNVILTRTASDNTWRGYLDGVEFFDYDDGGSMSYAVRSSATDIYMANGYNGYADCNIDEFAVWNSVQNVSDIYNSGTPTTLPSGTVAYWRMGEEATFTDNWLVNNSALDNYSTRSFAFDGVDDYIQLGSSVSFANEFSLSVWVKPNGFSTSQTIVGMGTSSKNWLRLSSANQITFRINATSLTFTDVGNNLVDGVWQHLLIYRDSSNNVGIFRNGSAFSSSQNNSNTLTLLTIGKRGNLEYTGSLDEIAFWTSDQSSNVSSIYNGGKPTTITGASAHWRMGENATFSTNWTVPDQVGSNDGTSANMDLADLEGDAPNYTGGGLSANMTIEDRVGEALNSSNNSISYNMDEVDRETDVPS